MEERFLHMAGIIFLIELTGWFFLSQGREEQNVFDKIFSITNLFPSNLAKKPPIFNKYHMKIDKHYVVL